MFVATGILFNHESPRRGSNFVTNKVVKEAVRIKAGLSNSLALGNLNAYRDWGHAQDYVQAMWMILQLGQADDFVCATGKTHSVLELVEYVFDKLGLNYKQYIVQEQRYFRPEEVNMLKGDCTKLTQATGWSPTYNFYSMLDEMIGYWEQRYGI
jgi:GDPmannose 4,6-dehydratase